MGDMLASAARQLVWRYLSLILSMLYCIVLITTSMSSPPRDSSVMALSVYQKTC